MPRHTPYDGSSTPFTIGVSAIDPADWLEVDANLETYLTEKDRLRHELPDRVWVAEPDTDQAQSEILGLVLDYLPRRYPSIYRRDGQVVHVGRRTISLADPKFTPLQRAASLVQEEHILMRRGEDGWRLAAGSLCFPSSWSLREKFGKPMPRIHAHVPGFGEGSRNIALIQRLFDHMRPDYIFARFNWGIYDGPELHAPGTGNGTRRLGPKGDTQHLHVRVERQTLRKLPLSGDILFTIRTQLDSFDSLAERENGSTLGESLRAQILALTPAQLSYKGLSEERDRILAKLAHLE